MSFAPATSTTTKASLAQRLVPGRGRWAGRYAPAAAMVVFALVPYLALSAALGPISSTIAHQLHMSAQTMSLGSGMANAGYAVGTVLAVQLAQHLPQRRVMVLYAALLVLGSIMAAAAPDAPVFIAGRVLQGFCTSLLLIAAVPALAIGFPSSKLRITAMVMNMCIFGAVALGPTIGGIQAQVHGWRPLFWIVAAISLAALLLSLLTFEDAPPADRSAPWAPGALALAAGGCAAAFFGASELLTHPFLDGLTVAPLLGGLALIAILIVNQYRAKRPLLTIRSMLSSTMPVAGIVVALFAAAASVSATLLSAGLLAQRYGPLHVGLLYLPELGGAVLTAFILGAILGKRQMHYMPLLGMIFLAGGIAAFRVELPPSQGLALLGAALTGIGLGSTVAPALFVAGFSLPATNLQRVFAIVELLRAVAAFMIAPVFAHFAATVGGSPTTGAGIALWIGFGLALTGAGIAVALYALGGARPVTGDIDRFLAGQGPAWYSPPLFAKLRKHASTTSGGQAGVESVELESSAA